MARPVELGRRGALLARHSDSGLSHGAPRRLRRRLHAAAVSSSRGLRAPHCCAACSSPSRCGGKAWGGH
eukprot:4292985-Alexandrium_andersonii.AAC.1